MPSASDSVTTSSQARGFGGVAANHTEYPAIDVPRKFHPHISRLLSCVKCYVPEPAQRGVVCFIGRHASFQVVLLFHGKMGANLFREIVRRLPPAKQCTEFGEFASQSHTELSAISGQPSATARRVPPGESGAPQKGRSAGLALQPCGSSTPTRDQSQRPQGRRAGPALPDALTHTATPPWDGPSSNRQRVVRP